MASRKEQKEQARAARLAAEQAAAAKAQRARRIQMLAGVIVIAVVVVVVAVVVSSSGGGGTKLDPQQKKSVEASVANALQGIPQSGNELGNPKAKVTMTYFGDLKCPYCMEFTTGGAYYGGGTGGLPQFIAGPVRSGQVKVLYKSSCTATCDDGFSSSFEDQQSAALSAGLQDRFWNYTEIFYREQQDETIDYSTPSYWKGIAEQIPGLNVSKWQTNITNPTLQGQVLTDVKEAQTEAPHGTPTIIMTGPKGSQTLSLPTYSELVSAMKAVA